MEEFEKFYNKALKFLSYRPRSEKEIRDKLFQKKASSEVIEKVIQKLKEQKFIDDEEFAKLWIESRNRSKPRSLRLIKLELKRKGITEEQIESGIKNQESGIKTDLEQAKSLVEKRIKRLRSLDRQKIYEKLGRFLASKGFGWDTIKQSIDEVLNERV
ncbi:MAG: regulatory protein RecX [Patescibacteria group bacterium]